MQALIAVLTIAAVFLGEIMGVALFVLEEFGVFDPAGAFEIYLVVLGEDAGVLFFALGAGLFGAWFGSRLGKRPQIELDIEMAPA
jgi:hypothetical protein